MTLTLRTTSLLLPLLIAGCASTAPAGAPPANKDKQEEELRQKRHGLEAAELELSIARLEAKEAEAAGAHALAMAEAELKLARVAGEATERALSIEESELALSLDRARQNVVESEQELAELETMYAAEEFATITKELVITRGRVRLEMSTRSLELAQRRAEEQRSHAFPRRREESRLALAKAERGLAEARADEECGALERRLSLLEAEHAVQDLKREVEKLEKKEAQGQPAP